MLDIVVRNAAVEEDGQLCLVDIGVAGGRIAAVEPGLRADAEVVDASGRLVVPGLVETHIHLDKSCIMHRCTLGEGTAKEAIQQTAAAKRTFSAEDVYERGQRTLEMCVSWGTMHMRTHVEVDPWVGMAGFEGVQQLQRDYAWALDLELCVFPQEGLLNNPGTDALLVEGLRRGARVIGAAPYVDSDPRGQIDRIFELAREFDVDIDMHLDLAGMTDEMQTGYVCRKTEEHGWGGRVAVGHLTQLSLEGEEAFARAAGQLARAGVAVTVMPATDLYAMGRAHGCAVPRGVLQVERLRQAGVCCSISTNNVLNLFTPYGDGSLVRMANLYANVAHVARPEELGGCLAMVTADAARLMRRDGYGIAVGRPADLVLLDADDPAGAVATLAQPLWGMKRGRRSFSRARACLHKPE